jgi:hypothetical protein
MAMMVTVLERILASREMLLGCEIVDQGEKNAVRWIWKSAGGEVECDR